MSQLKLYEITKSYTDIFAKLYDEETGEINMDVQRELDTMDDQRDKKIVAVGSWIKNMEAEYKAINDAKKAMAARESRLKRELEGWEQYLKFNMEGCGITEVKSPYFVIKLKKNPPSVNVLDELLVPTHYHKVKIDLDKASMLKDLKEGVYIPGAQLKQDISLQIK